MNAKFILILIVFLSIVNINAEMSFWTDTLVSNSSQTVTQHGFYKYDDTSLNDRGSFISTLIRLDYSVQELPFASGVDWCNFTIVRIKHEYDIQANPVNITTETQNYYFENTSLSSGNIFIYVLNDDSIIYDMVCHYQGTDNFTNYAYKEISDPIGDVTTHFPSIACDECSQYSLEQLSQMTANNELIIQDERNIYDNIDSFVDRNFKIWLITNWISQFGLFFASLIMIFAGVYYIFELVKDLAK